MQQRTGFTSPKKRAAASRKSHPLLRFDLLYLDGQD